MTRLIDADALYEQIAKKEELARQRVLDTPSRMPNGDFNPSAIRYATQLDERTQMKFMTADEPTIDTVPVRHGMWKRYARMIICSECHIALYDDVIKCFRGVPDYCPACGAKMRGEQK